MTSPRPSPHPGSSRPVVSPELALVDPALAAEERARLPDLAQQLPQAARSDGQHALVELAMAALDASEAGASGSEARRTWPRLALVAGGTALILLLLDVKVEVGRSPGVVESTRPALTGEVVPPKPAADDAENPGRSLPSKATARRFAWAPVPGADSYRVEFFRGATRVFAATTTQAQITVPSRWMLDGARRTLTRGTYRWYVWPIASGKRAPNAVVQAVLTVP